MNSLESRLDAVDRIGRARAVDPRFNVALEASAGTGKTRVLVERYINLLRAGVDPSNVLAITFTRKAATEMRDRIMATLRAAAAAGELSPARWRQLRDRTADIGVSTIDAFCLSLLREFPLEADLDPGFSMADETEVPRLIDESLDRAVRLCRGLAREREELSLAFSQLGERRLRSGLAVLLNRRIVAPSVMARYLAAGPRDLTAAVAARRAATAVLDLLERSPGGIERFIACGPPHPVFALLSRALHALRAHVAGEHVLDPGRLQACLARVRDYFLTQDGRPRSRSLLPKSVFLNARDWELQRDVVVRSAPQVAAILGDLRRDLNVVVSRGITQAFAIAEQEYRRTLERHAVLDFSGLLLHALALLRQMDEFSRSRFRLESRYHHVLVDEFQDTSRAQWELVSLLVAAWGAGAGVAHDGPLPPSVFIVGDRKQSIYGFRDADVSLLRDAARFLEGLRAGDGVRQSISRSFRSVPALLSFINDVCVDIEKVAGRHDGFEYGERDQFPVDAGPFGEPVVGIIAEASAEACADVTADEIAGLIADGTTVRDRDTGVHRAIRPGDVAILFRSRESHREFEAALERRGVPSYVYKGLGFFDADEVKDVLALLWYLADPLSNLRAAAFLRSRFVRLSDDALQTLSPRIADALRDDLAPEQLLRLDAGDRLALTLARDETARWRGRVDRMPPAELLDAILRESAYAIELRGARLPQAHENLKKVRALVRRIQNRGYATLGRIAHFLDRLAVGDDSNAVIDARDAVQLMTVHAAKGLEFPVVFLVNLTRGTGNRREAVRLAAGQSGELAVVAVGDFQSEADADAAARDREESKRVLYVALTRARDRLYISAPLKDGRIQPGRGSLAEVMPASLIELMGQASSIDLLEWRAGSGRQHPVRVCHPASGPQPMSRHAERGINTDRDFTALVDTAQPRGTIGEVSAEETDDSGRHGPRSERLLGTVVHRLVHRFGLQPEAKAELWRDAASRMLHADAMAGDVAAVDIPAWIERAVSLYGSVIADPEVRALTAGATVMHEVPFTMVENGRMLRGAIDCLVQTGARQFTVLEFKTGRRRPEHERQLELYRAAAARLFPTAHVEARLVYAGGIRHDSDDRTFDAQR
jgi:ATP-dependent helicase/nuclease subunit A